VDEDVYSIHFVVGVSVPGTFWRADLTLFLGLFFVASGRILLLLLSFAGTLWKVLVVRVRPLDIMDLWK